MKKYFKASIVTILLFFHLSTKAQETKVSLTLYEGVIIGGYVDDGAFLNFGGPNLNISLKNSKFLLGMFPSLRLKEDNATPKNALVTPALGIGFTCIYKSMAFQLPFYYNPKTPKENGKWNIGIGIGFKISGLNKK
jgi:hypothetical protein